MKIYSAILLALVAFMVACQPQAKEISLYVGTYSVENSKGIYQYGYHPETGDLTYKQVTPNLENPSFISISPDKRFLYAVSEVNDYHHLDSGSVTAYRIEPDGSLTRLNEVATLGNHPCHVTVSPDGKTVVASNYTSGSISIYQVKEDGSLVDRPQLIQHKGTGPDSARQEGPHAHSSQFTADGKTLITADLGIDKLLLCTYSADSGKYVPAAQSAIAIAPGSGPRHFDFTDDGKFIYLMTEMASMVNVIQKTDSGYVVVQHVSSLPEGYNGVKAGADIHLSPDGRFVYASNRGHNSIAVFQRNAGNGQIKLIQNEPVKGDWPRNFALSPDGKFLLVANQRSNNVTVFAIDDETGKLNFTGKNYEIPSPVCLQFFEN